MGLLATALLGVACAKAEEAAAPAPAAAPSAAPAAAPAPLPAAAPAPAPVAAPTPSVPADTSRGEAPSAPTVAEAVIRLNPLVDEPNSTFPRELIKFHPSKLPLWDRAVYGGVEWGTSVQALGPTINPFLTYQLGRPNLYGMFMLVDVGTCSLVGREDFSRCHGKRTNLLAGTLAPGIFEKWERPNSLTVKFTMRKGVLWPAIPPMGRTDREVTANDVVWYFETQKAGGIYQDTFGLTSGIRALDRYTVQVDFKEPHADFFRMVASTGFGIVPKECYEQKDCLNSKIISPGPYIIDQASYQPRVRTEYVKNEEFWLKGLPYLDRKIGIAINDPAAQRAAFQTGQIDYVQTYTPSERDLLIKQVPGQHNMAIMCTCGSGHLLPKVTLAPLNDVRVRQALSMAIDRPRLWQLCCGGATMMGIPMAFDYLGLELAPKLSELGPVVQYNPTEAKRLLKEAGYESGFTVNLWTSWTTFASPEIYAAVQDDWKRNLGVRLEVKMVDSATSRTKRQQGEWEGFHFDQCYVCAATDADSYFLTAVSYSKQNFAGINDPKIDEMYLRARGELDPAKRVTVLWEFTRRMLDQGYGIHVSSPVAYDHMQPWVYNKGAHIYGYASLTNLAAWPTFVDTEQKRKLGK